MESQGHSGGGIPEDMVVWSGVGTKSDMVAIEW